MSSSHRPHFGLQNKRLIDRLKLEAIKSHKLGSLHSQGVPEKYTVDLSNKKFS